MKNEFNYIVLPLALVGTMSLAKLVVHTTSSDTSNLINAGNVIRIEVNNFVNKWNSGDVISFAGSTKWKYTALGTWVPASSSDIADAQSDGVLRSDEDGPTCGGRSTNFHGKVSTQSAACRTPGDGSPLIIDLNGKGFKFGSSEHSVLFDLFADGNPLNYQWVRKEGDEAFLAIDINLNGKIDDGSELFGEGSTMKHSGKKAENGFFALGQYDLIKHGGNNDGKISRKDKVWKSLLLWNDVNSDGKSTDIEISKLAKHGLKSIKLNYKVRELNDEFGNFIPFWSTVKAKREVKYDIVDVFFKPSVQSTTL